jgi:hypothetical protein
MKRMFLISGLFLFFACSGLDLSGDKFGKATDVPIRPGLDRVESAALCRLASGEWLMLASRYRSDGPGSVLFSVSSKDEGKSWTTPDTAAILPRSCSQPEVSQLQDGVVTVLYGLYRSRLVETSSPLGSFMIRSYDRGKSFTAPQPVISKDMGGIMPTSSIIEGPDGEWAFLGHARRGEVVLPVLMVSDDQGMTWRARPLSILDSEKGVLFRHPAPAMLQDGKLICLLQKEDSGYLYLTRSTNLGPTWTGFYETQIYGKNPQILITRHNTLVCIYEDATPPGLSLRLSYDFGHSWEEEMSAVPLSLGTEKGVPYSVIETEDGIAILYVHDDAKQDIGLVRVSVAPPPALKGLSASVKRNAVSLRWNPLREVAYYRVYRDTLPDFTPSLTDHSKSNLVGMPLINRFIDSAVDSNQTVYYRVCGVRGSGPVIENTGSVGEPSVALRVEIP